MKRYIEPRRCEWRALCERAKDDDSVIDERVAGIIGRVRADGDEALKALAREIDRVELSSLEVSAEEIEAAKAEISDELKESISIAQDNVRKFHEAQMFQTVEVTTAPGVKCVQKAVPIQRVGLYVPGGTAPLFSTVLMLSIPAKVAGCREIVLCTPTNKEGRVASAVLYAASVCGVDHIYKVGGAQAIAAMAFGTETIAPVDKIFGPGNRYVTKAKEQVSRRVSIDMPAGPSEVMVVADETAVPSFVASDLLSQAEHGADSQVILVCRNEQIADAVEEETKRQLALLPRMELAEKALGHSRTIILSDLNDQMDFVNCYAPEHLILSVSEPWKVADMVTASGSVFIGNYSPESAGDYASGTNHTLPTSGWARSCSGVNVDSFTRKITYQELTREGIRNLGQCIVTMAEAEGLDAHANAARVRQTLGTLPNLPFRGEGLESGTVCTEFLPFGRGGQEGSNGFRGLIRPNIARLLPYSTARDEYKGELGVFLDANENPFQNGYNRYPDPRQTELKKKISRFKGVDTEHMFIGNGSDEAIDLCFRIFCVPGVDNAIAIAPSYGMYRVSADINDVEMREVQLNDDFSLPMEALLAKADEHSKLLFLCSPNNPTGNSFPMSQMLELVSRFPGIVVVDEAYIDFASQDSLLSLGERMPENLIVLQTMSKAYGMAGLRLGLAFGSREIMQLFANVKYPYNINLAGMQEAEKLLERDVQGEIEIIKSERARVVEGLKSKPNVKKIYPSDANFVLVKVDDADALYDKLVEKKIIVRNRSRVVGCAGCLRITIGTPEENDILLSTI